MTKEIDVSTENVDQAAQESQTQDTQSESQEAPRMSESETQAAALGWVPKEQWVEDGHDADDWKPAKVFLEHGQMIGKIRQQSRELDETRKALNFLNTKNKEVYEKGYQSAIKELREQKRAALAEGDLVKADEIDERIDRTKDELQQVRQQAPVQPRTQAPDPEHAEWLQRNQWYNDGVMQKFADALAVEYINVNSGQVTPADVRDFVEKEVKKEFAHKFKRTGVTAPNPDGNGRAPEKKATSGNLDSRLAKAKAEMSDEQRSIMKTMMRSAGLSEAEYLKMYVS
jgi:hypothetical protein